MPPMSACEELVGRPQYQVSRFQPHAAARAAAITWLLMTVWLITSFVMVPATLSGKTTKATKLKNAAHRTADRGLSTRVETTVATELAASCRPLRKSKVRATRISSQTIGDRAA